MTKAQDRAVNQYILQILGQKAGWPWIRDAVGDWIVIALTFCAAGLWHHPLGYMLAVFILGNRQHALALLGHEGTHYAIHKDRRINDATSDVLGMWMVGLTTSGYRNVHFQHHRHLNTERDPELMHRSSKAPQWDLPITVQRIAAYAAMDMIGYSASDYMMIVRSAKPDSKTVYIPMALMHFVFIGGFVAAGQAWVPVLWYFSLLTSFMAFFRIRTWLEHQGSDDTHRLTLTKLQSVIFAPHDSWYHYEHHTYPSVPHRRLGKVRQMTPGHPAITMAESMRRHNAARAIRSGTPLKVSPADDLKQAA
jgi:fatty acid desaturase